MTEPTVVDPATDPRRVGRITGSRIGKVLGLSTNGNAKTVLREMVRQQFGAPVEFVGNTATAYGKAHEQYAIERYEQQQHVLVTRSQVVMVHPRYDWLAHTPDGLVGYDEGHVGVVEAKCPYPHGKYTHHRDRPDFQAQMHLGMECHGGAAWADLTVWRTYGAIEDGFVVTSRLDYDPFWLPAHIDRLQAFHDLYMETISDRDLVVPHLAPLVNERDDPEWLEAAWAWGEAKADLIASQRQLDEAEERLKELAGGRSSRGGGVIMTVYPRAGSVGLKKLIADGLLDAKTAEKYRGKGSIVTSFKSEGEK